MKSNFGNILKVTGFVLGSLTAIIGLFVFFALLDSRSTEDIAWVGFLIAMSGILEGVLLAGFGQLVSDVNTIRLQLGGKVAVRSDDLPAL